MTDEKPAYYAVIPASVRYANITPNAKLLYGELTALCSKEGYCWASNGYFAKLYEVHADTITAWISELRGLGVINVVTVGPKRNITLSLPGEIAWLGRQKRLPKVGKKTGHSNTVSITQKSKSHSRVRGGLKIIKLKEEGSPEGKTVNEVIAAFKVVNPAAGSLFSRPKQRNAAEQLLKIYPLEQLLAIIECLKVTNELEYTPRAYDPVELLAKSAKILGKIREEIKKHKSDGRMGFDSIKGQYWIPGTLDKAGDIMRRALEKPKESAAPAAAVVPCVQ